MLGSQLTSRLFCLDFPSAGRARKPFCGMVCTSEIQPALVCRRGREILTSSENYQQAAKASLLGLWRPPCPHFCCFLDGFFNVWSAPLSTHCGDPKDSVPEPSDRGCSELELVPGPLPLPAPARASEAQPHVSPGARILLPLCGAHPTGCSAVVSHLPCRKLNLRPLPLLSLPHLLCPQLKFEAGCRPSQARLLRDTLIRLLVSYTSSPQILLPLPHKSL